jgi:hypothetical protein
MAEDLGGEAANIQPVLVDLIDRGLLNHCHSLHTRQRDALVHAPPRRHPRRPRARDRAAQPAPHIRDHLVSVFVDNVQTSKASPADCLGSPSAPLRPSCSAWLWPRAATRSL